MELSRHWRRRLPTTLPRRLGPCRRGIRSVSTYLPPQAASLEPAPQDRPPAFPNAKPFSHFLTDTHRRQHDYLRISITERCNLRCLYCMPEEGVVQSPAAHLLTSSEICQLAALFVSQGVTKIRLTGGEPTVRADFVDLVRELGSLRTLGLKELCLTTNGLALYHKLDRLLAAGVTAINLSLDTLDPFQFQIMTRRAGFEQVMRSLERILEMKRLGAKIKLKVNCVVIRGLNEREIMSFVDLTRHKDLEVRFIEYMPFDGNRWDQNKMLPFDEMLSMIEKEHPTLERVRDHASDTSKTYRIPGFAGRVGFITSMSNHFCGSCNRLRLTSDGNLKVCLFGNTEVSLRDILRQTTASPVVSEDSIAGVHPLLRPIACKSSQLLEVIGMAVKGKKAQHAGMSILQHAKNRPMILIGG